MNRRRFLANAGALFWLPVLESLVPYNVYADAQTRRKFVMIFSPNGMLMPNATNGNWTWGGALKPLVDSGLQNNAMIIRGLKADGESDPHWLNTAGFLSCRPITLASDRPTVCGKSFDQMVVEKIPTLLRSMHVGYKPMNRDFSADHGVYSDRYLDTIAWRADNRPVGNTYSPQALFDSIFGGGSSKAQHLRSVNTRRKSVIDAVLGELTSVQRNLSSSDKPRLEAYVDGVREVEKSIATSIASTPTCTPGLARPGTTPLAYTEHLQLMQQMVGQAFQCDLITSATIMYDDGVGDQFRIPPGCTREHHSYAHHGNDPTNQALLNTINVSHGALFAQFVQDMKNRGQLDSSLIVWGSNMSDGNTHRTDNLPIVLAGGGADLKWGQELNAATANIPKANLFVELGELYGLGLSSFGSGSSASNSVRIGLKKA